MKIIEIFTNSGINIVGTVFLEDNEKLALKNPGRIVIYPNIIKDTHVPTIYPILLLTNNDTISIIKNMIMALEEVVDSKYLEAYHNFLTRSGKVV